MKTLFLYIDSEMEHFFFEKEGDYQYLDGIMVNSCSADEKLIDQVCELLDYKDFTTLSEPSKDWDFFVTIGWIH